MNNQISLVLVNRLTGRFFNGTNFSADLRGAKVIYSDRPAHLALWASAIWNNCEVYQLAADGSFAVRAL